MTRNFCIRTRFFIAVEGEGERSFVKWLGQLAEFNDLNIHLDCEILKGGGYSSMLKKTIAGRNRKERNKAKATIMLVDADRSDNDDPWSLDELKKNAREKEILVCVQHPNQEGWLVKMHPKKELLKPDAAKVNKQLLKIWPEYKKPIDTQTLAKKFTIEDVERLANVDQELKNLLTIIDLIKTQ